MKEIRHLKTIKNKRNLNTKWLLLQNDQNADTTLLHSHDVMFFSSHDDIIMHHAQISFTHDISAHTALGISYLYLTVLLSKKM